MELAIVRELGELLEGRVGDLEGDFKFLDELGVVPSG